MGIRRTAGGGLCTTGEEADKKGRCTAVNTGASLGSVKRSADRCHQDLPLGVGPSCLDGAGRTGKPEEEVSTVLLKGDPCN